MTKKGIKQMAYRHPVGAMRLVCGAFFLALLGVCGYIGAARTHVQSVVSLPVTRVELEGEAVGGSSITQIRERLNRQREEELTLLDRVIADAGADSAAKEDALSQKTQIVRRMETEAQMTAVLEGMGAENALAVCGGRNAAYSTGNGDGRNGQKPAAECSRRPIRDRNDTTKNHSHQKISKLELYTDEKSAILMNIHREVFLK